MVLCGVVQTYQLVEELRKNKDGQVMHQLRELGVSDDQVRHTNAVLRTRGWLESSLTHHKSVSNGCWGGVWGCTRSTCVLVDAMDDRGSRLSRVCVHRCL